MDKDGAAEGYLAPANPRLLELTQRYQACRSPAQDHTEWTDQYVRREVDLRLFRSDNAYVWQHRDGNVASSYDLTVSYLRARDRLGLLGVLGEDGGFGAETFEVGSTVVSRDLIDSIAELYFLEDTVGLSGIGDRRVLDIGAGYGRLAHRLANAMPQVEVRCVDAVAVSTFLCEFYLAFRGVTDRAKAVPFYDVPDLPERWLPNLAVNIHSFSECSLSAIRWWGELIAGWQVRFLMVVPNKGNHGGTRLLSLERDTRLDFGPVLNEVGYKLIESRPKYLDDVVQRHGVSPTYHYLFALT